MKKVMQNLRFIGITFSMLIGTCGISSGSVVKKAGRNETCLLNYSKFIFVHNFSIQAD
jgi:hypothetical protein